MSRALVTRRVLLSSVAMLTVAMTGGAQTALQSPPASIPTHPRELTFPPLTFTPPERSAYRQVLAGNVAAYMVEDHDLPLVSLTIHIKGGSYLEPGAKTGLASMTGSQMRAGGAGQLTAEQFDEELDLLAANVSSGFGATAGQASASFLAKDTERALALFFDMLRTPRFQQDRLDLLKAQQLQAIERRNDSTDDIEDREWVRLIRGADHFSSRSLTKASIESIGRDDLAAFHKQYVHPGNFIVAVSGDFDTADMKRRLNAYLQNWPTGSVASAVPKPTHVPMPGLYLVNKPDVNQGRVSLGHLGIDRSNPDEIAVAIMNQILGGGSFTSRITARVRSDEGLAYSAGSSFAPGVYYPGTFTASFQSKSESVARAVAIVAEEIERIRTQPVSSGELDIVKNYLTDVFPRTFASPAAIANLFATDELTGRPADYWRTYRDRVKAVTVADVERVARTYLHPDRLVILAVGNVDAMLKGDPDRPTFSLEKQAPAGRVTRIPLPDPMTMVYPASGQ
ncbi:MAG: M16 family metallopeptidase [Vicinamibacterales bacterium]